MSHLSAALLNSFKLSCISSFCFKIMVHKNIEIWNHSLMHIWRWFVLLDTPETVRFPLNCADHQLLFLALRGRTNPFSHVSAGEFHSLSLGFQRSLKEMAVSNSDWRLLPCKMCTKNLVSWADLLIWGGFQCDFCAQDYRSFRYLSAGL